MKIGKKYNIKQTKGRRREAFNGVCISEEDRYYVLQHREGFRECFLKVDLETGYYTAKEA